MEDYIRGIRRQTRCVFLSRRIPCSCGRGHLGRGGAFTRPLVFIVRQSPLSPMACRVPRSCHYQRKYFLSHIKPAARADACSHKCTTAAREHTRLCVYFSVYVLHGSSVFARGAYILCVECVLSRVVMCAHLCACATRVACACGSVGGEQTASPA